MATGGSLAATLPRLREETELQKMLTDEKMRSEQHKNNYQTLKAEHTRLQDEYITIQTELKGTIEESKLVQEKYKALLEQARKDIATKMAEVDELKSQTLTSQRIEMIKLQVQEEVEQPFRIKFQKLDSEVEHFRSEYNKLQYENSFLKAEYEHEKTEHARIMEEQNMRFEAEVANLRRERETLNSRHQNEGSQDGQRVRTLQRENAQLQLRLKGVMSELEEIRAQKEHTGLQSDSVLRLQTKQIAEHQANVKALETERETLKLTVANLQREVSSGGQQATQFTTRIHDLEKENIMYKNRAEEISHKSKVEVTNLKMEMLKERGDLERERDRLLNEIEDLKSSVDIQKHTASQQQSAMVDKEREAGKRVQAAREEEWSKLHALENEKMELETKVQEMERRKIDDEANKHAEREKWEDRLRQVNDCKEVAEKEALVYKTKVTHQESLVAQLERERSENSELKTRLHRIETQYQTYVSSEQEFVDINERLKRQVEELREDLRTSRDEASRLRNDGDAALVQHRSNWAEERSNLQQRVDELEGQTCDLQGKLTTTLAAHKKRKRKVTSLVSRLKDRVTLQNARIDQLKVQNEALKKSVPSDTYMQLKKQMRDLLRRHQEFRTLMLASGQLKEVTIGDRSFGSIGIPTEYVSGNMTFLDAADQHEKDLANLKERLDMLDDHQQHQMAELRPVTPLKHAKRRDPPSLDSECTDTDRDTDKENVKYSQS